MSYEVLDSLLKEYEQKKLKAEMDLETRKEELYQKVPKLKQIEDDLNRFAIETTKNILKNSLNNKASDNSLKELEKRVINLKKEKAEILNEMNLPANYLTPFYSCQICKDTGYVMDSNYHSQMCNCLKQKLLDNSLYKSNLSSLEKENFDTFKETIFSDEVDIAKYKFNISPRKNN